MMLEEEEMMKMIRYVYLSVQLKKGILRFSNTIFLNILGRR